MLLACWLAPGAARADDRPNTVSHSYSPYEQASINEAAAQLETKPDPSPEGKVVEGIDVVTLDVIERRDPPRRHSTGCTPPRGTMSSSARCCSRWAKNTSAGSATRPPATCADSLSSRW